MKTNMILEQYFRFVLFGVSDSVMCEYSSVIKIFQNQFNRLIFDSSVKHRWLKISSCILLIF